MMRTLTAAERLIVAADFKPEKEKGQGKEWIRGKVLSLAQTLRDTGVYLKVNSALRACGLGLISEIQSHGLKVFADLKLHDIGETLATDGALISVYKPELLTTFCAAGVSGLRALKAELPDTEVLGVTVLTSLTDADSGTMFGSSVEDAVIRFADVAAEAGIDGLICSPKEAEMLRLKFGDLLSLNTPAIRPTWAIVPGDDQNPDRIMTPAKAILAGATRIVVGRPIVRAESPRDAVMRTLEEIDSALK